MGKLGSQVRVPHRIADLVSRCGQGLQLRSRRLTRPAGIEHPEMRGPGPQILEIHGRREVYIIARHRNAFRQVLTIVIGELYARSGGKIILGILYPVVQGKPVRIGHELIGIAEQAVKPCVAVRRLGKIKSIV